MAKNSKIEWTDHTFNPWIGCTKVSDGCKHCYAETLMDKRYGRVQWGPQGTRVRTSAANWRKPVQWNKQAAAEGRRYRVFCASLADVFEDRPELVEWRRDLLVMIEQTPNLNWLLLTKRPENVNRMISDALGGDDPAVAVWFARNIHVWIGTSVEDQETADRRIPELLKIPARVRFLSMEPLLGPVDIRRWLCCPWCGKGDKAIQGFDGVWYHTSENWARPCPTDSRGKAVNNINWVIVGGESGHNARPMHPDWARSIRDQCIAAGVAFHFKQWGEWAPTLHANKKNDMCIWPNGGASQKVGKQAAGRILDGRTWDEFPAVQP